MVYKSFNVGLNLATFYFSYGILSFNDKQIDNNDPTNKKIFCNTIASATLVHTSIQSD